MELFLPSLVFLLAGAAIAFFVLPTIAPVMLVGGSAAVLAGALYLHYSRFGRMEYEQATWQNNLRAYSSWIILAAVLLAAYGFYAMSAGGAPPPPVTTSVFDFGSGGNTTTSTGLPIMMGGGFGRVFKHAATRISDLLN
jgi:hypothetical protein